MESCYIILRSNNNRRIPYINEIVRVFYKGEYIDEFSKEIDKNKIYSKEEANKILKKYDSLFAIRTKHKENKGIDIIIELAYLEEKTKLCCEAAEWENMGEYKCWLKEEGYTFKELTIEEYNQYVEKNFRNEI